MSETGIYIHIPFCRSRCSYCDFATGLYQREIAERYLAALVREIEQWNESEVQNQVDTIYFGGGTPSLLTPSQIDQILNSLQRRFTVSAGAEITLELNPGSVGGAEYQSTSERIEVLGDFRHLGITRVSFGAQSFHDQELARLGRTHNAAQILDTFRDLRTAGFENISFDLIAGLPGQTIEMWNRNLDQALALRPEHLSFYLLEVHTSTPLSEHIKRGLQPAPDEDLAAVMYERMLEEATAGGYQHYEISNLCLPGFESRHNSKYWTRQPYIGFGCSAHSYDGDRLRWSNERDLQKYLGLVESSLSPVRARESLTEEELRAEALFLGLRMMGGISAREFRDAYNLDVLQHHREDFTRFREAGLLEINGDTIKLTRSGALLSNEVFSAFV